MADTAAEIAAKLGISTGEFKAALQDAGASVKSFASKGSGDADSLTESVHGIHKQMRTFHQFMMAGGIVEAVKGFFEMAIKAAEESKDKNDENAAAVLRFSNTIKSLHGGLGELAMNTVGFFNQVGENIGSATRYAIEFWQAQITGNDGNMKAFDQAQASERKANEMERAFAEEKKKYGEDFKKVNAEIKQTEKEINDEKEKSKSAEERLADLGVQRQKIEADLASGTLNALQTRQAELELLKNSRDTQATQLELDRQHRAEMIQTNKERDEAQLKGLTNQQKISLLTQEVKDGEAIVTAQKRAGADVTVIQAQLDERRSELAKAIGEEEAKSLARKKQIAGSTQEEIELITLQHRAILGIATGPEEVRLNQIKLQRQEREKQLDLDDLAEKAITGKLTPAEEKLFAELTKQKAKLDEQIQAQQQLIAGAAVEKQAQAQITDEYTQQVEKASQLDKIVDGFQTKLTRYGQNYQDQSTDNLQFVLKNLQKSLFQSQLNFRSTAEQAGVNPYGIDDASNMLQNEISQVQAELRKRSDFAQFSRFFGATAAAEQYGSDQSQKLQQFLTPDQIRQQANDISAIKTTLQNVFPAQARGVRP